MQSICVVQPKIFEWLVIRCTLTHTERESGFHLSCSLVFVVRSSWFSRLVNTVNLPHLRCMQCGNVRIYYMSDKCAKISSALPSGISFVCKPRNMGWRSRMHFVKPIIVSFSFYLKLSNRVFIASLPFTQCSHKMAWFIQITKRWFSWRQRKSNYSIGCVLALQNPPQKKRGYIKYRNIHLI